MGNEQVRFARIRGRIVPIKVKKGSGSRGGRLKASRNKKQKAGSVLGNMGVGTAATGLFSIPIAKSLAKGAGILAGKSVDATMGKKHKTARGFAKAARGTFKTASGIGKHGGKIGAVGGLLLVSSGVLKVLGSKDRSRQTRALNRKRRR